MSLRERKAELEDLSPEQRTGQILKKLKAILGIMPTRSVFESVQSWKEKYPDYLIFQAINMATIKPHCIKYVEEILSNLYKKKSQTLYQ